MEENKYLTITALTKYLKAKMDRDSNLQKIHVKAEISNFNHHSRGHMYLTLKDDGAQIKAVMFSRKNSQLKFKPENGMEVFITGYISIYEPSGQYQLYINSMEPDGLGALYLAYEQLKAEFNQKGYFLPEHKKPIKVYPKHIAILTSPTGAAVRDVLITLKRRYPIVKITVIATLVQGEAAKTSIVESLKRANELNVDTIILGRGGGSIEDLWGFNEKSVVEAIFKSKIPIISAVGHETDTTLSDLVADMRAPTPTAAAELAVPSLLELVDGIKTVELRISQALKHNLTVKKNKLNELKGHYIYKNPHLIIDKKLQQVDLLIDKLSVQSSRNLMHANTRLKQAEFGLTKFNPKEAIKNQLNMQANFEKQLVFQMKQIHKNKAHKLENILEKIILLNPLETLKRGYSLTYDQEENILTSHTQVKIDQPIHVRLNDGELICQVKDIRRKSK